MNLIIYNGDVMKLDGKVDIRCCICKVEYIFLFYVINKGSIFIFFKEICVCLGLI